MHERFDRSASGIKIGAWPWAANRPQVLLCEGEVVPHLIPTWPGVVPRTEPMFVGTEAHTVPYIAGTEGLHVYS